ncbi:MULTISPECIES: hypothetical protein [Streptomyces]|uniref:Secreted protein n=1 Tax=Streptomyces amritsarensis TaxID=681158 RepID=A0ABX3G776_9ACTN|nr:MULTISPECIES: hypothetical protein [Streptomyces]AQT72912.1 hypothetical protein B1K54_15700 [Streptomyces sp. fd1-xmd]MDX6763229.1 hypothetical protein [Streptomyces sp. F8]OLZ67951.1 hypothetical protein AVW11_13390 [Streptomyces amritsarensis]
MHRTKPSRARLLVPSALAVVILTGAAAPASALDSGSGAVSTKAAPAGPIDDLVNGLLEQIKALLPAGVTLPEIKIPEIKLPEIKLPEINLPSIPGVQLPEIPGVELPQVPLTPPALPAPAVPGELVPEIPDVEIPDVQLPEVQLPALP